MPSPNANPTPITPPRVPLIDPRTGLIDRAWYLFFLSLNNAATAIIDDSGLTFSAESTIASLDASLRAVNQELQTLPPPIDLNDELIKQIQAAALADCCSALVSQLAELQKQIDALNSSPHPTAIVEGYGYVVGPFSATDNAIARYDGTTGKLIQNSGVTIDDNANAAGARSLQFSGAIPATTPDGTMWFDSSSLTLNFKQGNLTQQIGEEIYIYGRASEAITNGQVIAVTGSYGVTGYVTFAPAPIGTTDPTHIIGLATEDIAKNSFGRITAFGIVHDLSTSPGFADGDALWYDPTVLGGYTKTRPSAPNIKVQIGVVTKAAGGVNGSIQVKVFTGPTVNDISNVQVTSVANNDLLQYDSALQYWKNVTPASVINSAGGAPVTKTANFSVAADETWLINNKSGSSCTVTLPTPSTNTGRVLHFQNYQAQTLVSASSNVVPLAGGAATTAILEAVAGANATLVSNGTNWIMTQYSSNNSLQLE